MKKYIFIIITIINIKIIMEPSNIPIQIVDLDKVNEPPCIEQLRLDRKRRAQIERSYIEQQRFQREQHCLKIEQMRLKSQIDISLINQLESNVTYSQLLDPQTRELIDSQPQITYASLEFNIIMSNIIISNNSADNNIIQPPRLIPTSAQMEQLRGGTSLQIEPTNVKQQTHVDQPKKEQQTHVDQPKKEQPRLSSEYIQYSNFYYRHPFVLNLYLKTANINEYFTNLIHEIEECFKVCIQRCSIPCFTIGIVTCCVGCFDMMSIITKCNNNCCKDICIILSTIISCLILLLLPILFTIYGTKSPIYIINISSNIWVIIEGISHISYIIILTILNHYLKKIMNAIYDDYTIICRYLHIINRIQNVKKGILFCKIIWTFLGIAFLINSNSNITFILIIIDIVLVNSIQLIGMYLHLSLTGSSSCIKN